MFDLKLKELASSHWTKLAFGAVVLVMLAMLVFAEYGPKPENLVVDRPLASLGGYAGTSGANARHMTELSATNQQPYGNIHTADVAGSSDLSQVGKPSVNMSVGHSDSEGLVNGRGEPDFWEIGSELAAYKRREAPGLRRAAGQEHMNTRDPLTRFEDDALSSLL